MTVDTRASGAHTHVTQVSRKTVTISLYESDLKAARQKMRALKKLGYERMSFSRLVRIALRQLDPAAFIYDPY